MLKVLQRHRHLRIVQISRVGLPYRLTKLVQSKSLGEHRPGILQSDKSIWLYGEHLVELRRQCEAQRHHVAAREPVKRTAFPSELGVSRAVRLPRFCGHHSCASRPSPGLAGWRRLWTCSQALLPLFLLGERGHAKL